MYRAPGWMTGWLRMLRIKGEATEGEMLVDYRLATHDEG